ncbi:MAG: DUF3313 domain-containing protein [Gammaproteobacteria bacterium]|nr:DUF3313 domain-containing protein [Gammaproteobacteria bacterium]MDH3466959.1 DUF3313 domain-containing protein [Gammaproteobacteria bacterium]
MRISKIIPTILVAVFGAVFVAAALAQSGFVQSGYLEDYSLLQPDSKRPGVYIHKKANFNPELYSAVMIGGIELWWAPDSEYKGIQPDKAQEVTANFRRRLEQWVGTQKKVVRQPGPGVMLVNVAITNLKAKRPKRSVLNYTPAGLAVTGAKNLAGKDYALADAYLEGELVDTESGEGVAMVVVTRLGERVTRLRKNKKMSWESIGEDLDDYAKHFSQEVLR